MKLRTTVWIAIGILVCFFLIVPLAHAQVAYPNRGGTGTATAPGVGQVLVGCQDGQGRHVYCPQATSSLGFSVGFIPATTSWEYWLTTKTTSALAEGSNLYYTVARAAAALTAGYNGIFGSATTTNATTTSLAVTGSFDFLGTVITDVGSWFAGLFDTRLATKSTTDLSEGSNLYFTSSRADARINATSTIGTLTSAPNLGTVSIALSGILKATSGTLSAATAGTDYLVPIAGNIGQLPYFSGTSALTATSTIFLSTAGRIGIGTTAPKVPFEIVNPVGGINERLLCATNANAPTTSSAVASTCLTVGNGSTYALGYGELAGYLGNGSLIKWADLTPFGTSFTLPVATANNKGYQSATTLGQTVNLAIMSSSNHAQFGAPYPATIPTDFYTGNTSADFNFYPYGSASVLTIKGTGNVGIGTTTPFSRLQVTSGASATTTATFGEVGVTTSKACFNTKNTAGADISFYFVGTSMVVENNLCK